MVRWAWMFCLGFATSCVAAQSPACKLANTRGGYGDIAECNEERFRIADRKMNSHYKLLLKDLADQPDKLEQLRKGQRSWLAHRDDTCMFWAGVVDYNIPVCRRQITEQRNAILKRMHDCLAEGGGKCS
jgi:uncharacterized protein YecT (DUF1311 family)